MSGNPNVLLVYYSFTNQTAVVAGTIADGWKDNIAPIKELGERNGGTWQGETHFLADGNQVMSMWSWLAFMRHNEPRARSFGKKLPRPNLKSDYTDQARAFAQALVDGLATPATPPADSTG